MKFENRCAVVTGGAGNIGFELCRLLGRNGVVCAMADINQEATEKAAVQLQQEGLKVYPYKMDVTNSAEVKQVCAQILKDLKHVDILVNNAGKWPFGKFLEQTEEHWLSVLDINLNSVFRVSQAFLPAMVEQQYGRIVNLGSIAGESGLPNLSAYSTSKAGVIMLTKVMAMEFARKNITVNCVSPGMILKEVKPCEGTWLGRCGVAKDVADLIAYLCNDEAGYITGVDYPVEGGRTLGPHGCTFND